MDPDEFWQYIERLVAENCLVIDRLKGSRHPCYPEIVYPLDYGYLDGTTSNDRNGIDVWIGGSGFHDLSAIILAVDLHKRDSEIKILLGCSEEEVQTILAFHNKKEMRAMLIRKP